MSLDRYEVDCSQLSPDEFNEIYEWFDRNHFMDSIDLSKPRWFISYWPDNQPPPFELREFPQECHIRKI